MALYDRLLGRDDPGNPVANKIPIHQLQAAADGCPGRRPLACADAR
jgi:hypothetical protein